MRIKGILQCLTIVKLGGKVYLERGDGMDVSLVDAYCLMDYYDVTLTVTQDSDLYHVYDNVVMAILGIVYDNVRMPSYTKLSQDLGY